MVLESRGMALRYLEITGGVPLHGTIDIQGSKNAVLPVLAASMLGDGGCVIENCPVIGDVEDLLTIMRSLGCKVRRKGHRVSIDAGTMKKYEIQEKSASRIRSSVLFLGALLGKMGKVVLPMPGGCAIGQRPIDLHLYAMEQLGVRFSVLEEDCRMAEAGSMQCMPGQRIRADVNQLAGAKIHFSFPSVGATENAILAAVMAEGETRICNAALEPEIDELCAFLNRRGARIRRLEDGSIGIQGVRKLYPVVYRMRADRIVAGTYLLAAAATGGSIRIRNFPWEELASLLEVLRRMGADYHKNGCELELSEGGVFLPVPYLETAPYPGFPTDLQSQLMAVLCRVRGRSCICERIFENRFATAEELRKMGADITTEGTCARIKGVETLISADVEAPDLRGGAALVIAALQTEGCTRIGHVEYIERGYENICRDLRSLGAEIRLESEDGGWRERAHPD